MPGRSAPFSRLARQIGPTALEGFENEGFVRFDDPAQVPRLVACRWRAEKPMTPTKRRRWMDSAEFRGLRQALALDHRARVIEPLSFLRRCAIGVLVSALNVRRQALAAKPQKPIRAAPADDFAARAMGTALSRHPLDAGRSERVLGAALAAVFKLQAPQRRAAFLSAINASGVASALIPEIANSQAEKSSDLHRIALSIQTSLTKSIITL